MHPITATHRAPLSEADERQRAFVALVEAHAGTVVKIARVYAAAPGDQRDLEQEILLSAWQAYPSFRAEAAFNTWLYRLALNVALTYVRTQRRRPSATDPLEDHTVELPDGDPLDPRVEALYGCIRRLDPVDRSLVTMHLDGYAHAEIAEALGASANAIGVRLHRLKARLQTLLTETTPTP